MAAFAFSLDVVTPLPGAAAAAIAFRHAGRLHVTVIVKATFAFAPDAEMPRVEPQPIFRDEVPHDAPARSVRFASDLTPCRPRAEVLLTGHAHAPPSGPVRTLPVRLAVFRGDRALLDKTLVAQDPAGFTRLPLVYERAYGGPGFVENPAGTGVAPGSAAPNLVDPARPKRAAGFAPIARDWPVRARLLGATRRDPLDAAIAQIPDTLDWAYFQAAPPDQQIDSLRGDEWIVLEGLHPSRPRSRMRLPDARGRARLHGLSAFGVSEGQPLELTADTLHIDADTQRCTLVWRRNLPLANDAALEALRVVAGVELPGAALAWTAPQARERQSVPASIEDAGTMLLGDLFGDGTTPPTKAVDTPAIEGSTVTLSEDDLEPASEGPLGSHTGAAIPGTVVLGTGAGAAPAPGQALPFKVVDSPWASPLAVAPRQAPEVAALPTGTVMLSELEQLDAADRPAQPFPNDRPSRPEEPRRLAGVPSASHAASVPRFDLPAAPVAPPAWIGPGAPPAAASRGPAVRLIHPASLGAAILPPAPSPSDAGLTVMAAATCDLIPGAAARLRAQAEAISAELAPIQARAGVTLAGHAVAPAPGARRAEVSFRFGHEDNAFHRRAVVFGDRRWERPSGRGLPRISEPEPFDRIPLTYERAFGGPDHPENPVGRGFNLLIPPGGSAPLPNLEDPDHPIRNLASAPQPACFAPLPNPGDKSAPPSQQLAFLRGDEPFAIAGVLPGGAVMEGSLPGVRVRAFARRTPEAGGAFEEVALQLDTAAFDTDARTVTLVFRGRLEVTDEAAPERSVASLFFMIEPCSDAPATLERARAHLEGR